MSEYEKKVPGGAAKVMVAKKNLFAKREPFHPHSASDASESEKRVHNQCLEIGYVPDSGSPTDGNVPISGMKDAEEYSDIVVKNAKCTAQRTDGNISIRRLVPVTESNSEIPSHPPHGLFLMNCLYRNFAEKNEEWKHVDLCADFVIFDVPQNEHNPENIDGLLRHVCSVLNPSGVVYAFCTFN